MKDLMNLLTAANQARLDKQYEKARHLYLVYLRENDDDADVMHVLAQVTYELALRKTEQMTVLLKEASDWMERAIALRRDRPAFFVTSGNILALGVDAPNYVEAANHYRTALESNHFFYSAASGLAFLAHVPESGVSYSEAIAGMEKVVEIQSDNQHAFMSLGYLYEKVGRCDDAQEVFKRAVLCSQPLELRYLETLVTPRLVHISVEESA